MTPSPEVAPGAHATAAGTARAALVQELALLGVVLIWGANFPIAKRALGAMHPLAFNALRFTLAALVLALAHVRTASSAERRALARLFPRVLAIALLGHFLYQVLFILGLARTTSGSAALLIASSPLWTAVTGRLFFGETLGRGAWTGLAVAFAGTALVSVSGAELAFGVDALQGNLLVVGSAIAWGAYTTLCKPLLEEVSPTGLALASMLCALPLLWAAAAPHVGAELLDLPAWAILATAYSGVFSIALAYVVWNRALRVVGAARTAIYVNLVPVVALAGSYVLLREPLGAVQLAGGALVVLGLVLVRRARAATSAA
jgi:drug/metabolite transporter (DMT)-like permease